MTDKQHSILLFSAIVPSTLCFIPACFIVLGFLSGYLLETFLLFLSCLFGILGYFGLISLYRNKFNSKVLVNLIRLTFGFIGYVLILFWTDSTLEDLILIPHDFWDFLVLCSGVLIFFTYIFYIILLSKKMINEK